MYKIKKFFIKYRVEICVEAVSLILLFSIAKLGKFNLFSTVKTDTTFTVALLALPITLVNYLKNKENDGRREAEKKEQKNQKMIEEQEKRTQELYSNILEKMLDISKKNNHSNAELEIKALQINALFKEGKKNFTNSESELKNFVKLTQNVFYNLVVNGIDVNDDKKTLFDKYNDLLTIDNNLKICKSEAGSIFEGDSLEENRKDRFSSIISDRILWKSEIQMENFDLDKYKEKIFYKGIFIFTDNNFKDIEKLNTASFIEPIFKFKLKRSSKRSVISKLSQGIQDYESVYHPYIKFEDEVEPTDFQLDDSPDKDINVVMKKDTSNNRKEIRDKYSKLYPNSIIKFSTTYNVDNEYNWNTWYSFTNSKINKIKSDKPNNIIFIVDGNSFNLSKSQENIRVIIFTLKDFLSLLDMKKDYEKYSAPEYKKFFYINFNENKDGVSMVDTRDIKNDEPARINVISE